MKKERIFYLDFIRAFATVVIVLTHYNALFLYNVNHPEKAVISLYISNIYIGAFGVSLFLIISGAALMYVYSRTDKFDWKKYFSKRFKTIYPMFWIAYILVFCINTYYSGGHNMNPYGVPKWRIILSILGIDGYASCFGISGFYIVGEWFLGFILIFYLLFPFLLAAIKKFPVVTCGVVLAMYAASLILLKDKEWYNLILTVRLPEIVFGMMFIKYVKKVPWYAALISLAVLVANQIFKPSFIDGNIQVTYVGICSFIILVYLGELLKNVTAAQKISALICKYSYACFIIHHWVIYKVVSTTDLNALGRFASWPLFFVCSVAVIVSSYLLQRISDSVTKFVFGLFENPKIKKSSEAQENIAS